MFKLLLLLNVAILATPAATLSGVLYDSAARLIAPTNLTVIGWRATNTVVAPGGAGSSNALTVLNESGITKAAFDKNGGLTVGAGTPAGAGNAIVTGTLTLNGTNLQTTLSSLQTQVGAGGTVSSVAATVPSDLTVSGSPITSSGTLAITRNSQAANKALLGPVSGGAATPGYRLLDPADIPTGIPAIDIGAGAVDNTEFSYLDGVTSAIQTQLNSKGAGTVTSIAISVPAEMSIGGSPVTSSGTITISKVSQSANVFMASPNGSSGVMSPRAIVAADLPTILGPFSIGDIPYADTSSSLIGGYESLSGGWHIPKTNAVTGSGSPTNGWKIVSIDGGDVTTATNLPALLIRQKNNNASGMYTNIVIEIDDSQQSSLTTSRLISVKTKTRGPVFEIDGTGNIIAASGHVTGVMTADGGFSGNSAVISGNIQVNNLSPQGTVYLGAGSGGLPSLSYGLDHTTGWTAETGDWIFQASSSQKLKIDGTDITIAPGEKITWSNFPGKVLTLQDTYNGDAEYLTLTGGQTTDKQVGLKINGGSLSSTNLHGQVLTLSQTNNEAGSTVTNIDIIIDPGSSSTNSKIISIHTPGGSDLFGVSVSGYVTANGAAIAAEGAGSVTSVAMTVPSDLTVSGSPITSSGTLAVTRNSQTANKFLASPNGSSGSPTYRAIVAADLPGSGVGSGTVTSVDMSVPSIMNISGNPITSAGTLALTLGTQTANLIWAGPSSGGAATPTFRALVSADMPAGIGTVTGTGTAGVMTKWSNGSGALTDGYFTESGGFHFPSTNIGAAMGSNTNWIMGVFSQAKSSSSNSYTWRDSSGVVKGNIGPAGGLTVKDGTQTSAGNIEATTMHTTGVMTADNGFSGNSAVIQGSSVFVFSGGGIACGSGSNPGANNLTVAGTSTLSGDLKLNAGIRLSMASGSNKELGDAVLVAGTVTVANTTVTANTKIQLTCHTAGGVQGFLSYTTTASTGFTINSSSAADTSTVTYTLFENP